jgi:hypothetical protein
LVWVIHKGYGYVDLRALGGHTQPGYASNHDRRYSRRAFVKSLYDDLGANACRVAHGDRNCTWFHIRLSRYVLGEKAAHAS